MLSAISYLALGLAFLVLLIVGLSRKTKKKWSDKALATRCATFAFFFPIVMCRPIIAGEFFIWFYGTKGIKLYVVVDGSHVGVWLT